jgi:hypothetical protein
MEIQLEEVENQYASLGNFCSVPVPKSLFFVFVFIGKK